MKDKDLILMCDGACEGHHLIFSQVDNPYDEVPKDEDPMVFVTVHLDTIPFWQRLRWVLTGRNKRYGHFVSTVTTKKKLQDIINQLE